MDKKSILIFGLGFLQKSLIARCKAKGLYTIGIDPCTDAFCKDDVDVFEVVGGQDYAKTLEVAQRYHVAGVITTATDKPLVMMARVAEALHLPFYSIETAQWSTDKYRMKQRFELCGVPFAKGKLTKTIDDVDDFVFPVIVKPRDNSGSRGVKLCRTKEELKDSIDEALEFSHLDTVLVEEYIEGQEYSIESIHYDGRSRVIQFTEKKTTDFPYNVELGHVQPAILSDGVKDNIRHIVDDIAKSLNFNNCGSHTELKIGPRGITVIETSPRLGGDFITSTLVPLSTGLNLEDLLIEIAIGNKLSENDIKPIKNRCSGVVFFNLPEGKIEKIGNLDELNAIKGLNFYDFGLKEGDFVKKIKNSLDRYGEAVFVADTRREFENDIEKFNKIIDNQIIIR